MRTIYAFFFFLTATTEALAISKADCAVWANKLSEITPVLRSFTDNTENSDYDLLIRATGKLKTAVDDADTARKAILHPLRSYLTTLEDLTYQLQLCARSN